MNRLILPSVLFAAGLGWLVANDKFHRFFSDEPVPGFIVDGLHFILNDENRGLWWNNPRVATQGCKLKRKTKRFEEAEAFCTRALDLSPDDPETSYEVGMYRRSIGQHLEAIPLLRKAADGGVSTAPAFLAAAYLSTHDVESATEWARQARLNASDEPYSWSVSCFLETALRLDDHGLALKQQEVTEICLKARKVAADDDFMKAFDAHFASEVF